MLQYFHRLSKGTIMHGPMTYEVTSELQKTTSIEIYEFCHEQNTSSSEFSMSNEISVSGVIKAFDIGATMSTSFAEISTKATEEGKEIKTYEEQISLDVTKLTRVLEDEEFLVYYVLIDLLCYTVNGGTKKYYAKIPHDDTVIEVMNKDSLDQLAKGTIHVEKDSFNIVASRYPSIKLDDISALARQLTPINVVEVNLSHVVILLLLNHTCNGSCIYAGLLIVSCPLLCAFRY